MGLIGGLFNKHTDENAGQDKYDIGNPLTADWHQANLNSLGPGLQSALQGQLGQGGLFNQAAQAGFGAYNQGLQGDAAAAQGQGSLAQMLMDQAQGKGPSLAQNLMSQGLQQQQAQAASQLASQQGINPALAARLVGQQQQQAATSAVGQAGNMRLQEQLAAQQGLGNVLAQQRQGSQGIAGLGQGMFGAGGGLGQQNLSNLSGMFNQENQNQFGLADRYNNQLAQQNAWALANQQMKMQQSEGNATRRANIATGNTSADNATGGAIMNAAGSALSLSDERAKTNIRDGRGAIDNLLDSVGQHAYAYKDQANGEGTRVGPMAQELEHSAVGKNLVQTGPDGLKRVDAGGAALASLAASAHLKDRLDDLEHTKTLGAHLLEAHRALSGAHEHIARFAAGGEVKMSSKDLTPTDKAQMNPSSWNLDDPDKSNPEVKTTQGVGAMKPVKMWGGGMMGAMGSIVGGMPRGGGVGGMMPANPFIQRQAPGGMMPANPFIQAHAAQQGPMVAPAGAPARVHPALGGFAPAPRPAMTMADGGIVPMADGDVGPPEPQKYADGGAVGGGDESAGLSMDYAGGGRSAYTPDLAGKIDAANKLGVANAAAQAVDTTKPSQGFFDSLGQTLANGWQNYTKGLSDKYRDIGANIANGASNFIGQFTHPGIQQYGGGTAGPTVQLGDSTAGAPALPSATSMAPSTSLGGGVGMFRGGPAGLSGTIFAGGGQVPGTPEVEGDSEKNDKVPALLSPGEVVLPRSVAKNPRKAASFVQSLIDDGEVHPSIVNWRHGRRGGK